jgi:hypothetical protein
MALLYTIRGGALGGTKTPHNGTRELGSELPTAEAFRPEERER